MMYVGKALDYAPGSTLAGNHRALCCHPTRGRIDRNGGGGGPAEFGAAARWRDALES